MKRARKVMTRIWVLLSLVSFAACGDVREISGVYLEEFPNATVPEERAYALRLTIFEFERQVGGWVEYYGQNQLNSPASPFVLPTHCAYFGPYRRTDMGMVMRAASPVSDEDLQLRFTRDGQKLLNARVEDAGGIFAEGVEVSGDERTVFRLQPDVAAKGCPEDAELIRRALTGFQRVGGTP